MCNPTAAASVIPMMISAGAQMAGRADEARHESRELERQAKVSRSFGVEQERHLRAQAARAQAAKRVAFHKGGVTAEGSPTDTLMEMARESDVDARLARFERTESAGGKEREARYRRRRSVLDQLSSTSALGENLIRLS